MPVEITYYILPLREVRFSTGVADVEKCAPSQAQFWGLYKLESDGCSDWISDHPSLKDAEEAKSRIEPAARLEPGAGTSAPAFVPEQPVSA